MSQNIVVVGGGSAGALIAKDTAAKLDTAKYRLILVTSRPSFTHLPGTIRTSVTSEGRLEDRVFIPYGNFLGEKGEVKLGEVVSFTADGEKGGQVVLDTGETIQYSVLVLAPGSVWRGPLAFPNSMTEISEHLTSWRGRIEKAKSIVLVGGGAVGTEFAGELKEFYPTKEVTIVHGERLPLNATYPDRFRRDVLARLTKLGVRVVLEDFVDVSVPSDDETVATRSGKVISTDLIIPTRGGTPNTEFIKKSLGEDVLTPSGNVKVLPTLQLTKYPRIFAAGDVIDWKEQKQAAKCAGHASVITQNVLSVVQNQPARAQYKGSLELISITLGKSGGASYFGVLWGLIFGNWFTALVKSKTLMIDMVKNSLGL